MRLTKKEAVRLRQIGQDDQSQAERDETNWSNFSRGLAETARAVYLYYEHLLESGFSEMQAVYLAGEWQGQMLRNNNGQKGA